MVIKRILIISAVLAIGVVFVIIKTANADITTGLIHEWNFEEGTGTTANDTVGTANGTLQGTNLPTWVAGEIGSYALQGTGAAVGANGYVTVSLPNASFPDSAFTISFWANKTGAGDQDPRALMFSGWGGNHNNYIDIDASGHPYAIIATSGGGGSINAGTVYGNNAWHFWTLTYDSSAGSNNFILYQDGTNVGSATITGSLSNNGDGAQFFGNVNNPGSYSFYGKLDDIRIYNRALSSSDVTQLFQYTGATVAGYKDDANNFMQFN
jgi:Concanavalin A-like lectin/glucanases superfamily